MLTIYIGYNALQANGTGTQNTTLGSGADVASGALTNSTAIGYGAVVSSNNTIQLGNTYVTNFKTSGTFTAGSVTYPNTQGSSGQVLSTTGSGTLSWISTTSITEVTDEYIATSNQTSFTFSNSPSNKSKVKMFINGIRVSNVCYSWSGTTLTYNPSKNGGNTLVVNDRIQLDYFY